jgi:hypothetical protein
MDGGSRREERAVCGQSKWLFWSGSGEIGGEQYRKRLSSREEIVVVRE